MKGTVLRVLLSKGYAFIRGEDGASRFAHVKDFTIPATFEYLREGQAVRFTPGSSPKGLRALEIEVETESKGYWDTISSLMRTR